MLLGFLKKKINNWKVARWERINKVTRKELMTFDTRLEIYPMEMQKSKKLGLLLSRKKYLTDGEYMKWYAYLTQAERTEPTVEDGVSDVEIY